MIKEDNVEIDINIQKIAVSKLKDVDYDNLRFGKEFSDHMFYIDYKNGEWQTPTIVPYQNLTLTPANATLHYGQAIFEGMKAFKNDKDEIFLFRPDKNIERFNVSAERLCMPEVPEKIFEDALVQLLKLDSDWIPSKPGFSLYIRPFMFATDEFIGVRPSDTYRFIIFTSPVSTYYRGAIKVKIEKEYTRAAHGGTGFAKCAGNYAMSLYPAKVAKEQGYDQLIWTDAVEHKWIEESGTMNIMFVSGNTIITPPTGDTILQGITRDSVLTLARDWGYDVQERPVSVDEIEELIKNDKLDEAFGVGTAATIAPFSLIGFESKDYNLSNFENWTFANKVLTEMTNIKMGNTEDIHGWNLKIS